MQNTGVQQITFLKHLDLHWVKTLNISKNMLKKPLHFCKKSKKSAKLFPVYQKHGISYKSRITVYNSQSSCRHFAAPPYPQFKTYLKGYPKGLRSSLQRLSILFHAYIGQKPPGVSDLFWQRGKKKGTYILYKLKPSAKLWAMFSQGYSNISERQSTQEKSVWHLCSCCILICLTYNSLLMVSMDHMIHKATQTPPFILSSGSSFSWLSDLDDIETLHRIDGTQL